MTHHTCIRAKDNNNNNVVRWDDSDLSLFRESTNE